MTTRLALVTGATGHIGGLLVPELLDRGWKVRVLSRGPLPEDAEWVDRVESVRGDASDEEDVRAALRGVDAAWYLLHSMGGRGDFVERDRMLAELFARTAREEEVGRLVYLSGLHPDEELSPHLASRVEVGEILLGSGVPTAVLQAGVVLGAGSASFEMLRHLTERLPAVVAPKWLGSRIQPIADADVVHLLAAAADLPPEVNRTFDVGGPDVLTYADLMRRYAAVTGLGRRFIATVPVLTPGLASHWVGLVTPVESGGARPLVGSLVHDAVARENDLLDLVPGPAGGLTGVDEAIRVATAGLDPRAWSRTLRRTAAVVGGAALLGSLLTTPDSRWYRRLDLPAWQPPTWAFPVVWTTLYATTTIASTATITELREAEKPEEATAFEQALVANMVLNAGWSGLFFRAHRPRLAAVECAALSLSSADLARRAAPGGKGRAVSLGAYAAWCGFATALTSAIARRNPHSKD
jgi:uncharacterized protein YbjT (DUF2867 family)/tryptophan-rich sensory protein